jgi:hypothetical protein
VIDALTAFTMSVKRFPYAVTTPLLTTGTTLSALMKPLSSCNSTQ